MSYGETDAVDLLEASGEGATMDFVVVVGLFVLFLLGLVLAIQGFVGKELNPEGQPFATAIDVEHPGVVHPPEHHRGRLMVIGVGLMVLAVALGLLVL